MSSLKVALVADWITHWGGAERILQKLMEMYPDAEVYTSVFFPERPEVFEGRIVHTSFIQYIPWLNRRHKLCMLLRPLAFSMFDFRKYDLVISSSSAEAKGIKTKKKVQKKPPCEGGMSERQGGLGGSLHICYCHTPTRYLWSHTEQYRNNLEFGGLNWLAKLIIPPAFTIMRRWDFRAAQRPHVFIANSITTQERIREYYKRESEVVYPFYTKNDQGRMTNDELNKDYYICLGRIVPYKRFDLAIQACNQLGKHVKIFTNTKNDESARLQEISGSTIEWHFGASDAEVAEALENAKGFIMPQEEDFGIVALEAMSHGIPVIAYGEGGASETVIHGETGLLFSEQTVECLTQALVRSEDIQWNREQIREQGMSFSEERFENTFRAVVESVLE